MLVLAFLLVGLLGSAVTGYGYGRPVETVAVPRSAPSESSTFLMSDACTKYGILPDGVGLWGLCHDNPGGAGGFSYSLLDLRTCADSHGAAALSPNASDVSVSCEVPGNSSLVLCNSTAGSDSVMSGYNISFDTAGGGRLACPNGAQSNIRQGAFQETCISISLVNNTTTSKATVLYAECAVDLKLTQFVPSWLDLSSCIHWNPLELQFEISAVNGDPGLDWCGHEAQDVGFYLAPRVNTLLESPFSDWFQTRCIAQLGGYTNASYHLGRTIYNRNGTLQCCQKGGVNCLNGSTTNSSSPKCRRDVDSTKLRSPTVLL